MKKSITIFIPGVNGLSSYSSPTQKIFGFFANIFQLDPTFNDHVKIWKKESALKNEPYIWMHWKRGIGPLDRYLAKVKLKKLLNHYKNYAVNLVGISLGGEIILETIKESSLKNIEKIILVGSVNKENPLLFPHPKIFNLYSKKDKFTQLARKIYSPLIEGSKLIGKNIVNIDLPNTEHHDFCKDSKIKKGKYKGKRITQIVNEILG